MIESLLIISPENDTDEMIQNSLAAKFTATWSLIGNVCLNL
jgi:hypothetical protein